jgi:linoleate 8R-lipoxygenase/9,12-octadecadienoate 8-hydroperoxide 8R-isomerase
MEGARIRSSVALPREVAKPTVIEDNGEKVTLKTGQNIYCNLVSLASHLPRVAFLISWC